jgi:hypothetical protein
MEYPAKGRERHRVRTAAGAPRLSCDRGRRDLGHRERRRHETDRFDVINFAVLFSGTAVAPPRMAGIRLTGAF